MKYWDRKSRTSASSLPIGASDVTARKSAPRSAEYLRRSWSSKYFGSMYPAERGSAM